MIWANVTVLKSFRPQIHGESVYVVILWNVSIHETFVSCCLRHNETCWNCNVQNNYRWSFTFTITTNLF